MAPRTWPVGPGLVLDCVVEACGAAAVLHAASGDSARDVAVCARHAVAQRRVADPERCPGGGVRLAVEAPPGEGCVRRVTVSMAQDRLVGPPPLSLAVATERREGATVSYLDADDEALIAVTGDSIQIHDRDTASWWGLRPGTPVPLIGVTQVACDDR